MRRVFIGGIRHMDDQQTREQLAAEVAALRRRVGELEAANQSLAETLRDVREHDALWRSILTHVPVDFWARDRQGNALAQSETSLRNWGQLENLRSARLDPHNRSQWEANNCRALQGEVVRGEVVLVTRSGQQREFFNIVAPIRDGQQITGVMGINLDVTEQKRAERALAESEARYRALVESSQDAIYQLDAEGRILFVNTAAARVLGTTPADLTGRTIAEVFPGSPLQESVDRVFQTGAPYAVERSLEFADTQVTYSALLTPVFGPDGKVATVVGISRDITAKRQAEEALRHSEGMLRSLFANIPAFVLVVNAEAQIQFANRAIPGASVEQLVGSIGFGHLVPEHQTLARRALADALATGQFQAVEVRDVYNVWWDCRVASLQHVRGAPLALVICSDVTRRKAAERAMQEKQRTLQQTLDVYEQHRKLTAYEIHDGIAQPLAAAAMTLDGVIQAAQDGSAPGAGDLEKAAALLRQGMAEARRLMVGLRPPVLDELGILPAIYGLVHGRHAPQGVHIDYVATVTFDRLAPPLETAVFRIVQEGLTNAVQHSQSPRIRIALSQTDHRLRIEIEDWGCGFKPHEEHPGRFGLKGIRERAGFFAGEAKIDSRPGQGTRVTVILPVVLPPPASETDEGSGMRDRGG